MDRRPPFPSDFSLILASQSPRRHSLLEDVGVPFTVVSSTADEQLAGGTAVDLAEANALAKVEGAVLPADLIPGAFVLGTDTLVTVDGLIMGKPRSASEAEAMLGQLSGRTHQVVSGVALLRTTGHGGGDREEVRVASAVTDVTFVTLEADEARAYIDSGEWNGKAGAYAIQGLAGTFVSKVSGEYSNVVGLPLCLLGSLFRAFGFSLAGRSWV